MDALDLSNLKVEKMNIINSVAKTLRILELCIALFFLSWFLTRLPFALQISADYLRSPLFVFAVSNAIIAAVLAQSRRFDQSNSASPVIEAEHHQISDTCTDNDSGAAIDSNFGKFYRRSQSEKLTEKSEERNDTARRELRRSETEKAREKSYPQDKLSNEEFRRTIEAFIANQMRLLREDSLAISLCN
ncbi:uncharacterized protein LOC114405704 [Glycine soja]|uniref:DUF4408 domain-containing protein n=1 Tax=Glycine soja TaxID=3848 RepID=A0A445M495_GLYSO|nr:uncharacterized protein LOC114405704 [Glycine soja]KHN36082.1 hypothetical protein glysoja_003205 [Glycine soja]RZC30417.1 hypothetical protein D0Y65_001810 [Glycine soja]